MPPTSAADRIEHLDVENYKVGDDTGGGGGEQDKGAGTGQTGDGGHAGGDTGTKSPQAPAGESGSDGDGTGAAKDGAEADEAGDGYVADELEDDATDDAGGEEDAPAASNLSPELKFIVDNLPDLTVRGKTNGRTQTLQVKAAGQLPDDFEFASKKDEMIFTQALAAQELKAQSLQTQYQRDQQAKQASQYSAQENADIRSDMAELQREGLLPKFKFQPDDRRFGDDAGVKAAQEVLEYMNTKNQEYAKNNKLYRISYRDAFEQLQRQAAKDVAKDKQAVEDKERKGVTRQLAGAGTAPSAGLGKPRIARNMGELLSRLDMME